MIMCGKQRLGSENFRITDIFHYRPCNRQSVNRTCSPANLIQNQQTAACGISQDICHFIHFHHKSTLSGRKIIGCPYTGKNTVYDTNIRTLYRDKTSNLCHQYNQGILTHIGWFSGHIWSGDNSNPVIFIIQIGVISDKHIVIDHFFHHRMTAALNIQNTFFIDFWSCIIALLCHHSQRGKYIKTRYRFCRMLDPHHLIGNGISDLTENIIFQSRQLIFCTENRFLQFFQFRCDITLRIGQSLLSCIIFRHKIFVWIRHFQIITKYFIKFDPQIFDTCLFPFFLFDFCQPVFSLCFGIP